MEIRNYTLLLLMLLALCSCKKEAPTKAILSAVFQQSEIDEYNKTAILEVTLSDRLTEDVKILTAVKGDAIEGIHFHNILDTLIMKAGHISTIIPLQTINNKLYDGNKYLEVKLNVAAEHTHLVEGNNNWELIEIKDDETLLSINTSSNVVPLQLVLTRAYSDLVTYEIIASESFTDKGEIAIEGGNSSEILTVYLRPKNTISNEINIPYNLTFHGNQIEETFTGTGNFTNQEDVKLITFEKSSFRGIEIIVND